MKCANAHQGGERERDRDRVSERKRDGGRKEGRQTGREKGRQTKRQRERERERCGWHGIGMLDVRRQGGLQFFVNKSKKNA